MKSLVLAEKPSVAREIARVLGCRQSHKSYMEGDKYIVTWALGHLIELKMPEHYDSKYKNWNLEDLPIIPDQMGLKVMKQTSHQYKAIENLAKRKDIKEIIIATDAGREGELVARWILEKIRWRKTIKRLWISSVTDRAIRDGFQNLKPGKQFEDLYESAVCRAEADWLIGLNVTRALTTKYKDPLSAGRVQTPTLALVMEREKLIQKFVPKEYWTIRAHIGPLQADWEKNGEKRLFSKDAADDVLSKVKGQKAVIQSINRKEKTEPQPLPYDLTELQRDANKRFGFSAKKTSNVLQKLYEQHKLVTYPRTDSRYLTKDMEATMMDRLHGIAASYKDEVKPILANQGRVLAKRVFNNEKVTDHHAIIPTEERVHLGDLSPDERKLYELIMRRFLAIFHNPYKYETVHAVIDVNGETFTARETAVIDPGYRKVERNSEEEIEKQSLRNISKGQSFTIQSAESSAKLTEPPLRYSEADILTQMEKYSLGTPATRAEIIERLLETEALERQNGRLFPTKKGKQLMDLVNEDLKSPELTAKWEQELEKIARGKADPKEFLQNIRKQTRTLVSEIKKSDKSYRAHNLTGSKCPECDSFLKERNTKDGKILVCSNLDCSFRKRKDPKLSNRRCPQCRKKMEIHQGKAGAYFQCRSCNVVEKAQDKKKAVNKREERKLVQKYTQKEESFGTSLGDLLKAAMEDKD
ncbi:DNA topoisomerase III [Cytobacillus firmus]|uniref:DNA topoisomerase III n=1 Tax=Cytobacillus firmus TaxID=1399 RepID=UPI00077C8922|nr:DNA topoisomerase III [Cytobacillus firmus]MBG9543824.1 DNA topoisomerase III [Cytobacillus firmus]MBG9546871.1 DNA topoisomerase III [Cytobacillus firmus]MBG9552615.1 DNA topoisomerase III [Cytobacillus firmus]MBG9556930.1 DNA topoisomerase III [Cytobacillus firmus]MBG9574154.1 DNA topoisomerase III [Cytobacillus firmus]